MKMVRREHVEEILMPLENGKEGMWL